MTNPTQSPKPAPLHLRGLTVAYGDKPALWNVSTTFPEAHLCAIVGPNGAGKSTLLKASLGLLPIASGKAEFFGQTLDKVRRRVAYVPQRSSVDWDFPTGVLDVVTMGLYRRLGWVKRPGKAERAAAMHALEQVAMADYQDRQISQLSGGQQQRVFLARALVQDAELYLMDEPFAGVDATTEDAILTVLRELQSQGSTVVVVHHDLDTVREYFDHLTLLNREIVASGPMEQTFTSELLAAAYGGKAEAFQAKVKAAQEVCDRQALAARALQAGQAQGARTAGHGNARPIYMQNMPEVLME